MADRYVYSGAGGAGTGADWANAYTTLGAAFTGGAAGDRFFVAHDHAETQASAMTLTCPGTAASPCQILCVDRGGTVPPVSADLRTTATVTTTGANALSFAASGTVQYFYCYGITFAAGTGATNVKLTLTAGGQQAFFERCGFQKNGTTGVTGAITLNSAANANNQTTWFKDCKFKLGATTDTIQSIGGNFYISDQANAGSLIDTAVATPSTLFTLGNTVLQIDGADLSAISGALVTTTSGRSLVCRNCKLHASVTLSGTISFSGAGRFEAWNCDSGDTNYRLLVEEAQGSIKSETTLVKTGGASDGTTPVSWKMASVANAEYPLLVLRSPEIVSEWIESVGSAKTITVDILHDSATALTDAEIWIEVQYLGTSGFPLGLFIDDAKADVLASAANQASSSATWTTTGMTNPNTQKLEVTFTPQEKGVALVTVCMAKASYTVYVDPKATVS